MFSVHDGTGAINCLINPNYFVKNCYREKTNERNFPPEIQFMINITKDVYKQIPKESDLVPGQPVTFNEFKKVVYVLFFIFSSW